jgi:ADP-heptose:LPS heptosyltransferase
MTTLENVTIICIDTVNVGEATIALKKTLEQVKPTKCKFLTTSNIKIEGVETIIIPEIRSVDEYSKFCIKELYKYIDTDFVLLIQHDGYVLNGDLFDKRLYLYDYCGALWNERDGLNNGNGGFSWRSKKLCEALGKDEIIEIYTPEDVSICRIYRRYLEGNYGFKWATDEIAEVFSFELKEPKNKTFGFHGSFHSEFKEIVVIQRMGAMGDVIGVEPVLRHFYENGYRVILHTLPQFKEIFRQHYYKIEFFDEIDNKRLPYKFINLDMSYESNPKELHLKSYYEFAGIKNGVIRNPRLSLYQNYKADIKLFEKYCIIHADIREPFRNMYDVNWPLICKDLNNRGYSVFQVGTNGYDIPGAIRINTPSTQFLMWVVASSDMFIGIDSGISHIAAGFNIPSIIFSGSVDLTYIHPNMDHIVWIHNHDKKVCDTPFCWHDAMDVVGKHCPINALRPPCTRFDDDNKILNAIKKITYEQSLWGSAN